MRIIICGAGRIGEGIAWLLSQEKHDLTVIDADPRLVNRLTREYDVAGVVGHAAHPSVLSDAGIEDAEMVIAVTQIDEVNMVICQIAHSLFDVPTKIARIRSQAYLEPSWSNLFSHDNLPVDTVVSPEAEVGDSILARLETPGAFLSTSFADGMVKLIGLPVEEKSPIRNTVFEQIDSLFSGLAPQLIAVGRDNTLFTPKKGDQLRVGDRLYWVTPTSQSPHLLDIMGIASQRAARRIIIAGGGKVGVRVARKLESQPGFHVSLIESDSERANAIAATLDKSIVMNGDALDPDILIESSVEHADLVLGVTNDDKTNLLLAALAKSLKAKKVLALVNDRDLARLHNQIGVDSIADPKPVTFSRILLHLRKGRLIQLQSLENSTAEIVEGVVMETSPLIGSIVSNDTLPEGLAIGALIRDGQVLPLSEPIQSKDHLIVFSERGSTHKLERLFRVSPEFF